jgi:hypothetical protein
LQFREGGRFAAPPTLRVEEIAHISRVSTA